MLTRFAPRFARSAWTAPRRALPRLAATRAVVPAAPMPRALTTTAVVAKKKKGGDKAAAEPPADVEGQLDLDALNEKMTKTVARCAETVQGLVGSLGRVDASLLDPVRVQYGKDAKPTPLHDYATVGVRDNCLVITAYDESSIKHIERGIYAAKLDLTPRVAPEEGEGVLVVPVPKPTGETRQQLLHKCSQACEHAKIALRNERHTAQKQLKHDLDNKVISKNTSQKEGKRLEDLIKAHTAQVERIASDAHKRLQN
ncbi:hypothetical protein MBRA1_003437 [Malassezia brasiliensis]|uniref:Ribosome recycling factor domain-containing protein n=1 Tax=Malassezia brasiliensis TaxID=1821822 RepID=A0AAF0DZF5_9BASI|nr:hypothetical protein MBRA1_003437 [Malassezia brasiliensis]